MIAEVKKVDSGPLAFEDSGGCSIGWLRYFPYDAWSNTPASALSPEAFKTAEDIGGSYSGMHYRKAWLATIKVPSQSQMREPLLAAGYVLIATSPAAHDSDTMELWGKGFTVPARENKPAQKLRARTRLVRHPHRRAAHAA